MGKWVGTGLTLSFFGKSSQNSHIGTTIWGYYAMCILCTLLKVHSLEIVAGLCHVE